MLIEMRAYGSRTASSTKLNMQMSLLGEFPRIRSRMIFRRGSREAAPYLLKPLFVLSTGITFAIEASSPGFFSIFGIAVCCVQGLDFARNKRAHRDQILSECKVWDCANFPLGSACLPKSIR